MTEKNLIRVYTGATSEKRIDIIIKNYTKFIGIVDGYTDGLRYMIECEKESSHRQSAGDLGVRVQTGGMTSDPTARKAINNVITREALINCDFSGNALDGVNQAEVYIRDAYILRDMRKDYNLFNSQLGILGTEKETADAENKSPYEKAGKEIHGWTAGRDCIMGMTAENIAEKRCYTVKEVQEMLGISRPTVYELLKKNEFRWIQIGNKYRISKKSFDEWLDQKSETI